MRLLTTTATATAALTLLATTAHAQVNETYLQGVIGALTQNNLTGLATAAQSVLNTTLGTTLFSSLPGTNKTILAPSNEAFAAVQDAVGGNTTLLAEILAYHVVNASVETVGGNGSHVLYRSFYNSGQLPANATQPVVFANGTNGTAIIVQPTSNATILAGPVRAANLLVYVIDQVLTLPRTLSQTAGDLFGSLAGLLGQANLVEPLEAIRGITVFAPIDSAITPVADAYGQLNSTAQAAVLANHVINGSVVYSPLLTTGNYTSAAGEPFTFSSNSSGAFVSSGGNTARIVQADIIISNGVVHLIDAVLVNAESNSTAASAAQSSYSVAATATTTGTAGGEGPIGSATATGNGGTTGTGTATATASPTSGGQMSVVRGAAVLPLTGLVAFVLGLL